jgi:hypothetical protein
MVDFFGKLLDIAILVENPQVTRFSWKYVLIASFCPFEAKRSITWARRVAW